MKHTPDTRDEKTEAASKLPAGINNKHPALRLSLVSQRDEIEINMTKGLG